MAQRSITLALLAATLLSGCGGESSGLASAEAGGVAVITAPPTPAPTGTPTPTPTGTPTPTPTATPTVSAAGTPFAGFNFASGNAYPATPTISIGAATYNGQSAVAYVPVTLSAPAPTTVIAPLLTQNGSGATKAVSGTNYAATSTVAIFRPGDPLTQTVAVPIINYVEGSVFNLITPTTPQGATRVNGSATVTANALVAPTAKAAGTFRTPRTFAPTTGLSYELTGANVKWSEQGGPGVLSTSLVDGTRTQLANTETGLYLDNSLYPHTEAPFRVDGTDIVLRSQKLATPIIYNGASWSYGAAMLEGRNSPETHLTYGQYEWTVKMPNRPGAWPALWLISTGGWPPEIDVYEGFGYKSDWNFNTDMSATIHGGANNSRTFMNYSEFDANQVYFLSGFANDFHKFAIDIEPDYITWFVDGMETFQAINPFAGKSWFPLMNVAVKTTDAYNMGSGDMVVRSMKVYSK